MLLNKRLILWNFYICFVESDAAAVDAINVFADFVAANEIGASVVVEFLLLMLLMLFLVLIIYSRTFYKTCCCNRISNAANEFF